MGPMMKVLGGVGMALALAGCAGKQLQPAPTWLNLTGSWQLNERESASLAALDDSARGGGQRGGRGMPGGGGGLPGGGGGFPGGGGGMPGGGGRGGMPGGGGRGGMGGGARGEGGLGMMPMAPPLERFTIEQHDTDVFFRFAPKEGVSVPTSWQKTTTRFWPGTPEVELKAKWSEDALVVERSLAPVEDGRGGRGLKITERYTRARESNRLIVTTELPGGRKLRRVYELVPPQPR